MNNKPFNGFNHGTDNVDLRHYKNITIMKPIEIHLKEDGSITDEPSLVVVLENSIQNNYVAGEISLEMLNNGLSDIGYKLVKI